MKAPDYITMNNYRLNIQYDGGRYKGWQRLGDCDNTIQEKMENVLSLLTGETIELIGSSRTDAGVHAYGQVANFWTSKEFKEEEIKEYLNRYLPKDICVTKVTRVPDKFHSRYHAIGKTYLYRIWNVPYSNPFMRKYSMHVEESLNISLMEKAAGYFIGEHDFTAFSNAKSKKKSMVRTVTSIDITKEDGFLLIRVTGNGFLHNMVRWIVGTMIDVGLGRMDAETIPDIIASKRRDLTGNLAEACGLFLEQVYFDEALMPNAKLLKRE